MGVVDDLYMYDVVVKKFAISSPDEFLVTVDRAVESIIGKLASC